MKIDLSTLSPEDFEFLIEAILKVKGFMIESRPGRGPDRGKDLLVTRSWSDDMNLTHFERWLVECKHFSVSGRSVTERDLGNFESRMKIHKANRYLLATSTIVSEVARDQITAVSDDPETLRMGGFWTGTDIRGFVSDHLTVREKFFFSWEREATEAANYLKEHHMPAHRGAVLWCPGVTAVFGNDGYSPNNCEPDEETGKPSKDISQAITERSNEATKRSQEEVNQLQLNLQNRQIAQIGFGTSDDGYTWCVLARTDDAKLLNDIVWTCYPLGVSNSQGQQSIAFERLWSYWQSPHKAVCPGSLPRLA
ncbi:MAG: restriction endonuclease [Cyanobacteria bacterium P01_D01_bin.36]